mgnify:CR=1
TINDEITGTGSPVNIELRALGDVQLNNSISTRGGNFTVAGSNTSGSRDVAFQDNAGSFTTANGITVFTNGGDDVP